MNKLLTSGIIVALAISASITGCSNGSNSTPTPAATAEPAPEPKPNPAPDPTVPDPRFELAAEVTESWCVESFRVTSGFAESTISDSDILNDLYSERTPFSGAKSVVDASLDTPIELRAYSIPWCMPELPAPEGLSENLLCKMPNQSRVSDVLGLTPDNAVGTCRERNEAAFEWALAQLTEEERMNYEANGIPIEFLDDQVVQRGGDWLLLAPHFMLDADGNYELSSPSLQTPYIPSTDNDSLDGVHYCTLFTPAQALYWVLHRGMKEDPGQCVAEDVCLQPDLVPEGSCIFYFEATVTHMCEEYRGPYWDQDLSTEKCASRGGSYSTSRCFERGEEIAILDSDDSGFIGTCDVACGQEERIWYMFSQPPGTNPATEFCFTPAEGHPLLQ
ncbi:Uncharacterised protein [Halioglobus japonicus]|nr:Uncharacterised protein [Halioglobus japonicus]